MKTWHKILLGIFGIGVASAAGLTLQTQTTSEITLQASLQSQEAASMAQNGKYIIIPPTVDPATGDTYRVDTVTVWDGHKTPKNQGYEIYLTQPNGAIMATGTGDTAAQISHDFISKSTVSTSATTTP